MQLCLKDMKYPPDVNALMHFLQHRHLELCAPIRYSVHITVDRPTAPLSVYLMDGLHHFHIDEAAKLKSQFNAQQEQLKKKTTDCKALQKQVDTLMLDVKEKQHVIQTLESDLNDKEFKLVTVKGIALSLHEKAKLYNNEVDRTCNLPVYHGISDTR